MSFAVINAVADQAEAFTLSGSSCYETPIANVPLIGHVFAELAENGVERTVIIAPADVRRELESVLEGGRSCGVEVAYSDVPEAAGHPTVLRETVQALADEPVLVYPADTLFPGQVAALRERYSAGDVDCVLLGPSADVDQRESPAAPAAVMLGPGTQEALVDSPLSRGLTDPGLMEILVAAGCRVAVCEATKHWRYDDSTEGLLAANRMVLDALRVQSLAATIRERNQIYGRVAISADAHVSNSTVYGPVVIDDDAVVVDSFVGPYTAIGRGAKVSGTELDNCMVLPFAEVGYAGLRIEASIIGERASVSRSFELPKGLHLRLTPGSRVTLS